MTNGPCCHSEGLLAGGRGLGRRWGWERTELLVGCPEQLAVVVQHVALLLLAVISDECLEACYPPIRL